MFSYFRLIGLYVHRMDGYIKKVLHAGWYPFGDYAKPRKDGYLMLPKLSKRTQTLYKIHNNVPQVHVCCIAGKNGSGKSSILEIIYRILNNLAFRMVEVTNPPIRPELDYAHGVCADLYYEIDGVISFVRCDGDYIKVFKCVDGKTSLVRLNSNNEIVSLVSQFFYTIGFNYSLYAFNKSDYESPSRQYINREWLTGIFHKNDGYMVPLSLVPFREDGIIQLDKENRLAKQRIIVLSLLSVGQKYKFPEGYKIKEIRYSLENDYVKEKQEYLRKQLSSLSKNQVAIMLSEVKNIWDEYEDVSIEKSFIKGSKGYDIALFYLTYKTIKICLTYNDYYELMQMKRLIDICQSSSFDEKFFKNQIRINAYEVINKIREDKDPITLKIHQCIDAMRIGKYRDKGRVDLKLFEEKGLTYDQVVCKLPPPFYDLDIIYVSSRKKVGDIYLKESETNGVVRLSQMSSGERQMLYCASYIIYHLKNLQTVKEDSFRFRYHYVNIIMDEVELYFHPEYQRLFISFILDALHWAQIDGRKIRGINILMATHSPFVLSDILTEHTLYLRKGNVIPVKQQTFGGNYYEMLRSSFFFEKSAVGEISSRFIEKMIKTKEKEGFCDEADLKKVGDPIIKNYLEAVNVPDKRTE